MSFKHEVEIDPYAEAHEPYPLILAEKVQIDCYIRLRVPRTIDVCLSSLQLTGTDTTHVAVELKNHKVTGRLRSVLCLPGNAGATLQSPRKWN